MVCRDFIKFIVDSRYTTWVGWLINLFAFKFFKYCGALVIKVGNVNVNIVILIMDVTMCKTYTF